MSKTINIRLVAATIAGILFLGGGAQARPSLSGTWREAGGRVFNISDYGDHLEGTVNDGSPELIQSFFAFRHDRYYRGELTRRNTAGGCEAVLQINIRVVSENQLRFDDRNEQGEQCGIPAGWSGGYDLYRY